MLLRRLRAMRSAIDTEGARPMSKKIRFTHLLSLSGRLEREAARLRAEADLCPPGPKRDFVLRKARQVETATHVEDWLTSPGLQPPA
jgi:hypothetical protein